MKVYRDIYGFLRLCRSIGSHYFESRGHGGYAYAFDGNVLLGMWLLD